VSQQYVPIQETTLVQTGQVARRLLWHVYSLGTIHLDRADHHRPFEKPGAHLFWVVSGRGIVTTQGHEYRLERGKKVWFIDMMKTRTYLPDSNTCLTIRGIRFGGPGLEAWHEQLGGNRKAEFSLSYAQSIHRAFGEISRITQGKAVGWEWQVHMVLQRTLGVLLTTRQLLAPGYVELPASVVRVLNAIAANPLHDWKVKDLSSIAGLSYSGLRTLFLTTQGESLHEFILRSRLDQARLLLADTRLSLKQIAEQMDFSSEFYFSHFFKRRSGISPSQYRGQLKGEKLP
jgi:AraC-like DNA-binding protein